MSNNSTRYGNLAQGAGPDLKQIQHDSFSVLELVSNGKHLYPASCHKRILTCRLWEQSSPILTKPASASATDDETTVI